jgi:hypothetical protein
VSEQYATFIFNVVGRNRSIMFQLDVHNGLPHFTAPEFHTLKYTPHFSIQHIPLHMLWICVNYRQNYCLKWQQKPWATLHIFRFSVGPVCIVIEYLAPSCLQLDQMWLKGFQYTCPLGTHDSDCGAGRSYGVRRQQLRCVSLVYLHVTGNQTLLQHFSWKT